MSYQIIKERPKNISVYLNLFWLVFGFFNFIIELFPINNPRRSFFSIDQRLAEIIWNIIQIPFRITDFVNETVKTNLVHDNKKTKHNTV